MWCLAVSMLWCSIRRADLILGVEELELHDKCRGRSNFRKIRIATVSVRMVKWVYIGLFVSLLKWSKSGFLGSKSGSNASKPTLYPLETHFGTLTKPIFNPL